MIEIKDFKPINVSQSLCSEETLFCNEDFIKLKQINDYLSEKGFCHVRVKGGDYDGSIAKFTPDVNGSLYKRVNNRNIRWNVKHYWDGRLSWKGKRNNPKFDVMYTTCDVLLDYEGDEILKRFDIKKESKKLLEKPLHDIDGHVITKGDEVLYVNIRYGNGSKLCHGVVSDFKAHARDGYVSVIVTNKDNTSEKSECHQPHNQIYIK